MPNGVKLATAASSKDPVVGLRAVASLRLLVEELQDLQVENARAQGWSWQEIAAALNVSKQAVHKKYAGRRVLRRRRG
jgi:ribosome-binding protein aMBF1 (putative translation factor)